MKKIDLNRYVFGEWVDHKTPLSVEDVAAICSKAVALKDEMADYPLEEILRLFGKMKKKWEDPKYPLRKEAESFLPEVTGFSREMIDLGIKELCFVLDPNELRKKISTEFRLIPRGSEMFYNSETKTALRWHPIGTVLHILSGNVFLVGPGSLIEGLITGNVNILKNSSSETRFLPLFIKSMIDCDEDQFISKSIAIIDYASSQTDVMDAFKKRVDGIAIFGGETAVKSYREKLPASVKLVVYGPKMSMSIITSEGLKREGKESVAKRLVDEISIWDQNACTAPQACYIEVKEKEKAGKDILHSFAKELSQFLEKNRTALPAGDIDPDAAVEIQKIRSVAEIAESREKGLLLASKGNVDWTVIVSEKVELETSPLHRTIKIMPYREIGELVSLVNDFRGYIQTIGLSANPEERLEISHLLGNAGALRIVEIGNMAGGNIDDPHDGAYDLPQFMNLVKTDWQGIDPIDRLPQPKREKILTERLRHIVDVAKSFPFYQKRLEKIDIETLSDLSKAPVITREEYENNLSSTKDGQTSKSIFEKGGYITRSGGSTGVPKFSYFDHIDWNEMVNHAMKAFKACGLNRGDRIANCLFAGDLYGSFISFDHVNHKLGLTTLGFAEKLHPVEFLAIAKKFNINALQGFPPHFSPLLQEIHKIDPSFKIEKIMYAGQPLSKTNYTWLKDVLGVKRIASIIGTTEAGEVGYQCDMQDGTNRHHLIDEYNLIEIVDEKGAPLPDGETGFIAITTLRKFNPPLIRYLIGDSGRIIPEKSAEKCSCGRTARVLEYMGRADDMIAIGLMNVKYSDLLHAIREFPVQEMQLIGRYDNKKEILCIMVEVAKEHLLKVTKEMISNAIHKEIPDFGEHNEGEGFKLVVEIVEAGKIPRNPRTGKLKHILDERVGH